MLSALRSFFAPREYGEDAIGISDLGLRNTAAFGLWIQREGWRPTSRRCAEHGGNLIYRRVNDEACSGELYLAWKKAQDA